MKTKDDLITDFLFEVNGCFDRPEYKLLSEFFDYMQQWTSTSNTPPITEQSYQILVKKPPTPSDRVMYRVIPVFNIETETQLQARLSQYTHWRPIEFP